MTLPGISPQSVSERELASGITIRWLLSQVESGPDALDSRAFHHNAVVLLWAQMDWCQ